MKIRLFYDLEGRFSAPVETPEMKNQKLLFAVFPTLEQFKDGGTILLSDFPDNLMKMSALSVGIKPSKVEVEIQKLHMLLIGLPKNILLSDENKNTMQIMGNNVKSKYPQGDSLALIQSILELSGIDLAKIQVKKDSTDRGVPLSEKVITLRSQLGQNDLLRIK